MATRCISGSLRCDWLAVLCHWKRATGPTKIAAVRVQVDSTPMIDLHLGLGGWNNASIVTSYGEVGPAVAPLHAVQ
jgi:hypothetical protein